MSIEPEFYLPIIPMILINGTEGIGTGYSTYIPPHNPIDIVNNIYKIMENKKLDEMKPWFKNFKGKIVKKDSSNVSVIGKYNVIDDNNIRIEELPIGLWTTNYKIYLESIEINNNINNNKNIIDNFRDNNTENNINFELCFPNNKLELYIKNDTIENKLKLVKNLKMNNMHLFDKNHKIKKYNNTNDILLEWYELRLNGYIKRKKYYLEEFEKELNILKYKVLFINNVLSNKILINNEKKKISYLI